MTREEALKFISELKKGKRFSTRLHENSWGLYFIEGKGNFCKWSERVDFYEDDAGNMQAREDKSEDVISESELIDFLMEFYSYDILYKKLRD